MLTKKTLRNGKISVSSTYFEDIQVYKMSLRDAKQSDYVSKKWRTSAPRDFSEIEMATVVQTFMLAKKGLAELDNFVQTLNSNQLDKYVIKYGPWKDYESYEILSKIKSELEAKEKLEADEVKELDRVTKEINDIDRFVSKEMEKVSTNLE